jgi:hypothetical protein
MAGAVKKDSKVLEHFIQIYCDTKHIKAIKSEKEGLTLCPECYETLVYSRLRRELCPLDPKPACKNCEIHCYKPDQRQKIKDIMRHSGMHLIKRGRIDMLLHYFF